jgi:hypothetical protein
MDDITPSQNGPAAWFKIVKGEFQLLGDAHP